MSKFIYEKCEFEIGESFCEFCRCNKYEKIPDGIRLMEIRCPNFENESSWIFKD